MLATFFADAEAVDVRAGDVVLAGAGRGAVGSVKARGAADGAVVALRARERERRVRELGMQIS